MNNKVEPVSEQHLKHPLQARCIAPHELIERIFGCVLRDFCGDGKSLRANPRRSAGQQIAETDVRAPPHLVVPISPSNQSVGCRGDSKVAAVHLGKASVTALSRSALAARFTDRSARAGRFDRYLFEAAGTNLRLRDKSESGDSHRNPEQVPHSSNDNLQWLLPAR